MQIKKIPLFALMLLSFSAVADVQLSQADLLGTWQIDKESTDKEGIKARSSNTTWTFKENGVLEGITQESDAHARLGSTRAELNYTVESGKLVKQAAPGRSKMETCVAAEKEGNKMVLKCPSVYYFMTKK